MPRSPAGPTVAARRWRVFERAVLVAGVALFALLLREIGPRVVLDNIRAVGWGIGLIVLQEALAYTANTLGWRYAFPSSDAPIGFTRLLGARIAGDAINYVTPTATLGGEFVRIRLLRQQAPATTLVASVAIAKLSQTVGQVAFIVVGLLWVLERTPLPPPLRRGLLIGVAVLAAAAALLLVMQRNGLFAPLLRALHALGLPRSLFELAARLQRLDDAIVDFHASDSWSFVASAGCFFIGWALGVLEVYLILFLLGVPITFERALAIEVFSAALDAMLFFVPGKVGTQEGGKVLIFSVLGLDVAKGLSLGILRRIRELVWAGIGLLILSRLHGGLPPLAKPEAARG